MMKTPERVKNNEYSTKKEKRKAVVSTLVFKSNKNYVRKQIYKENNSK